MFTLKDTEFLALQLEQSANDHRLYARPQVENIVDVLDAQIPLHFCCLLHCRSELFKPLEVKCIELLHVATFRLQLAQRQLEFKVVHLVVGH